MCNKNEIVTNHLNNCKGTLSIKISKAFIVIHYYCEISYYGWMRNSAVTFWGEKVESLLSNIVHFFRDWDYSKLLHPIECSWSFSVWFQQSRKWDFFFILLLTNSCETDQSGCGWKKATSFRPSFTMEQVLSVTYRSISHGEHLVSRHLGLSCKIRTFCGKETGRNHVIQGKLLGKDVTGSTASRNIRPVIYSQCEAMPIKSLPTLLYCGYSILFFSISKINVW